VTRDSVPGVWKPIAQDRDCYVEEIILLFLRKSSHHCRLYEAMNRQGLGLAGPINQGGFEKRLFSIQKTSTVSKGRRSVKVKNTPCHL